jgi:protein gp37
MKERDALAGRGSFILRDHQLNHPSKLRNPAVIGVQFMGDLFHEEMPDEFIFNTFAEICRCRGKHSFLILTKRPERMLTWFSEAIEKEPGWFSPRGQLDLWETCLGLTVCNQAEADEKIPVFLQVPGKKFLSIEPMLGPVDLWKSYGREGEHYCMACKYYGRPADDRTCVECGGRAEDDSGDCIKCKTGTMADTCPLCGELRAAGDFAMVDEFYPDCRPIPGIAAVILGGETGPGARPMHPDWVRGVRDQCEAAGVPFFFKQWGEWIPQSQGENIETLGHVRSINIDQPGHCTYDGSVYRVGKRAAGNVLDGYIHDTLPWLWLKEAGV